jgi:hypothetical protein
MQASALLLFRSCCLDHLIDLTRSQSSGLVSLRVLTNDFENLRLRRGQFDIIADIQKNCGRVPRFSMTIERRSMSTRRRILPRLVRKLSAETMIAPFLLVVVVGMNSSFQLNERYS